jgi:hypothetical protein
MTKAWLDSFAALGVLWGRPSADQYRCQLIRPAGGHGSRTLIGAVVAAGGAAS